MPDNEPQRIVLDTEEALALWDRGREAWNAFAAANPDSGTKSIGPAGEIALVLKGKAAIALWRKGKRAWNAWTARNTRADVDFSHQHLEPNNRGQYNAPLIDFSDFNFPEGRVIFDSAIFGDGTVSFHNVSFGNGTVSFVDTSFGKGFVTFDCASFGEGTVSFLFAKFDKGNVHFESAEFGQGAVYFVNTTFGEGEISFKNASFGEGEISFAYTNFDDGDICFDDMALGKGEINFSFARFGCGAVSLCRLNFEGTARFDGLKQLESCTLFSFEGSSFDKLFTFSHEGRMGCPLDLRRTKLTHGIVLHDVKCDYVVAPASNLTARLSQWCFGYPRKHPAAWGWRKRAIDREDSQRFRRLKELAQNENNRAKALEFNKLELRSQRGHDSGWLQDILQSLYSMLSNYGQSVLRPIAGLVATLFAFAVIFWTLSPVKGVSIWTALTYSGSHLLSFIPSGLTARTQGQELLFGAQAKVPEWAIGLGALESIVSVILLFLLGLGLRNMFRL